MESYFRAKPLDFHGFANFLASCAWPTKSTSLDQTLPDSFMVFNDLIFWSDNEWLFNVVTWGLYSALVFLVFVSLWQDRLTGSGWRMLCSPWLFTVLACIFILSARWPGFFHPEGINPDEDQLLIAAWALTKDPVFFRSAECGSSGPMNVYPLLLPTLLGVMPSLFSGRLVAVLMLMVSISALYYVARYALSEWTARAMALIALTFFGWTHFWDFRHYTSEHPPVFFMALAWAALSYVAFAKQGSAKRKTLAACFSAICLALVPLAKLQAIYPAAFTGMLLLVAVFFGIPGSTKARVLRVILVSTAALAIPLGFAALFASAGVAEYAWLSYIGNALAYRGESPGIPARLSLLWLMLTIEGPLRAHDLSRLVLGASIAAAMLIAGILLPRRGSLRRSALLFTIGSILILLCSIYSITAPMRPFPHYLVFLPLPLALVCAGLFQCFTDRFSSEVSSQPYRIVCLLTLGVFILITAFPVTMYRIQHPPDYIGKTRSQHEEQKPGPLAKHIFEYAAGGNGYLAVWGYNPEIYTQTGMYSATRLSTSSSLFNDNDLKDFFLASYLEDLQNKKPSVFVDAVAPEQFLIMTDRSVHGYEQIPEIQLFVDTHYRLAMEFEGVRIFVRVDSLGALTLEGSLTPPGL